MKYLFKWGAIHEVHDGRSIKFWQDVWAGDTPLKIQFPKLLDICDDPELDVHEVYGEDQWRINFRRSFGEYELRNWEQMMDILEVNLTHGKDKS